MDGLEGHRTIPGAFQKAGADDPDDEYGPSSLTNQRCHLNNCARLQFDGLALARRNVADLDVDFIEQDFWPVLKAEST